MNLTPQIAQELITNSPPDLQQLLADPRTTDEARNAVASLVAPPPTQKVEAKVNGSSSSLDGQMTTNKAGDGRLQVVNENQEFT